MQVVLSLVFRDNYANRRERVVITTLGVYYPTCLPHFLLQSTPPRNVYPVYVIAAILDALWAT
jgi:hypothetical protein